MEQAIPRSDEQLYVDRKLKMYQTMLEPMFEHILHVDGESAVEVNLKAAFLHMVKSASLVIDVLLEPS